MKLVVIALLALIATEKTANIRPYAQPEKETAEAKEHDTKYSPDLNAHEIATEPEAEKFFNALLAKTQKLKDGTNAARKQSHEMCVKEIAATKTWIKEGLAYEGEADRKASQAKLKAALEGRIAGLKKALARLKKLRHRLFAVILRVNQIFRLKYYENGNYSHASLVTIAYMTNITTKPVSPRLNPIRNFAAWHSQNAKASLIEVSQSVSSYRILHSMTRQLSHLHKTIYTYDPCHHPDRPACETVRKEAFELYSAAISLSGKMFENFEKERSILASFREGLKQLIADRRSKLARLAAQLKRVMAAMARDETFDSKPLKEHLAILEKACPQHEKNAVKEGKIVDELYQIVKENHSAPKKKYHVTDDATGAETGAATGGN
jgi:hypothetical protein